MRVQARLVALGFLPQRCAEALRLSDGEEEVALAKLLQELHSRSGARCKYKGRVAL